MRRPEAPAIPIGPAWLRESGLDATALGSHFVLTLIVASVVGFLGLHRQYRMMWLTLVSALGGTMGQNLLKRIIGRERPSVVPHLQEVTTPSFPSGHAMLSAIVYLTMAAMLMQVLPSRVARLYCLIWAMILSFLVGVSRIYLGVHYPTDVLAGWMAGLVWALACWLVAKSVAFKRPI